MMDTPATRREALLALGAVFATALGWHGLVPDAVAETPLVLEEQRWNGMPCSSPALLLASLADSYSDSEDEWHVMLHDAVRISEAYSQAEIRAISHDIFERGHARDCPACYGTGLRTRGIDGAQCGGSGLTPEP
jgi:hypothetical protein